MTLPGYFSQQTSPSCPLAGSISKNSRLPVDSQDQVGAQRPPGQIAAAERSLHLLQPFAAFHLSAVPLVGDVAVCQALLAEDPSNQAPAFPDRMSHSEIVVTLRKVQTYMRIDVLAAST